MLLSPIEWFVITSSVVGSRMSESLTLCVVLAGRSVYHIKCYTLTRKSLVTYTVLL